MSGTQAGFLLISDISGYTMYLSDSELEHAQGTLTGLLELLVEHTRPPLVLSRLEGDAVISYGLQETFYGGQTFIELIEDTYVAFRRAIELMVLNNTCQCRACANVNQLDLKFFTHYGQFAIQRIGDHDELVGSDVNLIHRLLKNHVRQKLGVHAYTIYTDAVIEKLGLDDLKQILKPHQESYEHLGEVKVWVQDMHPLWEQKRSSQATSLAPDQITYKLEQEFSMSPEILWDYLSRPEFRAFLFDSDRQVLLSRDAGRITGGTVYQCYHGNMVVPHTILEWEPFERIVTREVAPIPIKNTYYFAEYVLTPSQSGTTLRMGFTKAKGAFLGRVMLRIMEPMMGPTMSKNMRRFKEKIESDLARHSGNLHPAPHVDTEALRESAAAALKGTREPN